MFHLILNNTDKNKYTKSYVFVYSLRYIHISRISPKITKKKSIANSVAVYEAQFQTKKLSVGHCGKFK